MRSGVQEEMGSAERLRWRRVAGATSEGWELRIEGVGMRLEVSPSGHWYVWRSAVVIDSGSVGGKRSWGRGNLEKAKGAGIAALRERLRGALEGLDAVGKGNGEGER